MIHILTEKQLKDYNILGLLSSDTIIEPYYKRLYFESNNPSGPSLIYKGRFKTMNICIPDNEIWYLTYSGLAVCDEFYGKTGYNVNLVDNKVDNGVCKLIFDGALTTINGMCLCGGDVSTLILPSKLQYIGDNAFADLFGLNTKVILPSSVSYVGKFNFRSWGSYEYYEGLKPIIDLSYTKITEIKENAFEGCYFVSEIRFPKTLKKLGNCIFSCIGNQYDTDGVLLDFSLCESIPEVEGILDLLPTLQFTIVVPDLLYEQWTGLYPWNYDYVKEKIVKHSLYFN